MITAFRVTPKALLDRASDGDKGSFADRMMFLSVVPVVPSPSFIRVLDPLQMQRETSSIRYGPWKPLPILNHSHLQKLVDNLARF